MIPALLPFGWAASTYLYWVQGKRFDMLTGILDGPDPQSSPEAASQIYEKTWEYEFPFLSRMAFHFGVLRACAIPSIAKAICQKNETQSDSFSSIEEVARTFEDTDLLMKEMTERPVTNARAQRALERASRISSMYKLTNDEYCYILAIMVVEPCRLVERWGYRQLAKKEKEAHFEVWRSIGMQMGVKDIPNSFHAMEEFALRFEARYRGPHPSSKELASAAIDLLIETLPMKSLHSYILPIARRLIHTMLDPSLRDAFKIKAPPIVLSWFADFMLKVHAGCVRYLLLPREAPARRTPEIAASPTGRYIPITRVYGDFYLKGYRIDELGPKLKESLMTSNGRQSIPGRLRRALSLTGSRLSVQTSPQKKKMEPADSAVDMQPPVESVLPHAPVLRRRATTIGRPNSMIERRDETDEQEELDDDPVRFRRFSYADGIHAPVPRRALALNLFTEEADKERWGAFYDKCID
ncbi:hypothetical protein DFJ77DRAFT_480350 [Powellomyces hirtus]|nr:hypothetical protein DFJ77DRAFT_480350 [Powellomyces hirtus]